MRAPSDKSKTNYLPMKTNRILRKLSMLGYKFKETQHTQDEVVLKIYLPVLCYLKIKFSANSIKISSRTFIGIDFLSVEWNLIIYSLVLTFLLAISVIQAHSMIVIFFAIFILYYLMCIIKLEALKVILCRWIDIEFQSQKTE